MKEYPVKKDKNSGITVIPEKYQIDTKNITLTDYYKKSGITVIPESEEK